MRITTQTAILVLLALTSYPLCGGFASAEPIVRDFRSIDFFPAEKPRNSEEKVGGWIYKAFDNPGDLDNQLARGAAYSTLDLVGGDEQAKAFIDKLEEATEFEWGDCSELQLRGSLEAETCLGDSASLSFDADYDLQGAKLEVSWNF